ncbi:MAG: leucine-rich repeat domain-containing protein [Candidatus Ornithospirochaeta sp.]
MDKKMRMKKNMLIVFALAMILFASCSIDLSPKALSVTYLGPDGEIIATHTVGEGEMDIPPEDGELPVNGEFYWSLEEDGEIFDFSTPITDDITLHPIAKTKRVNVDFYYSDGRKIASKLCKTGSKVSVSDLGFSDKLYAVQVFDKDTGVEFTSSLSYKAEGYSFRCEIHSNMILMTPDGLLKASEDLRKVKGSYVLNIPRYLDGIEVKSIDNEAFSSLKGITAIVLPDTLGSIGVKTFMNCTNLTEATLPRGVSVIGDQAFAGCSSLKSFTFQNEVTTIGKGAFSGCSALSEIILSENLRTIGDEAFKGCANLEKVTLNDGLEYIGDEAFASCVILPAIFIPRSVSYIGIDTFYDCRIMKEITIDKDDALDLPGAVPWGGYEMWYESVKSRGGKLFGFTVKNLKNEVLFSSYPV